MLTPADQKVLEEAIQKLVDTRVQLAEEEMKNKYDTLAEEYCKKEVAERVEKEKAALVESYDETLNNLEKKIVSKLDSYLDHVITEQISDETLNKIAVNEVALPLVVSIKKLFSEHFVELDSEGSAIIKEKSDKIVELEGKIAEMSKKIVESEERLEKSASFLLISEKTAGLTETQKQRVVRMFKNKAFDEIKETIDEFVSMIKETKENKIEESKNTDTKSIDTVITEGTAPEAPEPKKTEVITEEKTYSLANEASRYMN
jgi:hypothetical protein